MFYHNVTKGIYNESDVIEFMDNYDNGDFILRTEFGDATIHVLEITEINELCMQYQDFNNNEEEV